jgi:short-subunit dehydrogenase
VVIVFGASGAVGREMLSVTAERLQDVKLVAVGVDKATCEELEKSAKVHCMCKDATDPKQVSGRE